MSLDQNHQLGLADFSNEAIQSVVLNKGTSVPSYMLPSEAYQDVKEYFARPRLVGKFTAPTTRTTFYTTEISEPVNNFWPVSAAQRLNGVYGYRATIKFTLTVAATPFQQGLGCVNFQYGTQNDIGSDRMPYRFNYPPLVTNLPHARLNFSDNTIAELELPYLSPFDFFEYNNKVTGGGDAYVYSYGRVALTQLLPYVPAPGSTAPIYSLYISLHDMELFGAVPVSLNAVVPQSGVDTMNKERRGTISGALAKASTVSSHVSKIAGSLGVPHVAASGATISWLAEKLSGTAKSLGYSRPIVESNATRVALTTSALDSAVDVPDVSVPVAPFISNRLDVSPSAGSNVDEMSMQYVLGKYCQTFVGSISTSYADGVFVYASRLCPTNFWFRTNSGTPGGNLGLPLSSTVSTNSFQPTTLAYIGTAFRYWRGGLKFRFTFAKTKFHAGRLVATFVPSTSDPTDGNAQSSIVPLPEVAGGGIQPFTCSAIFDLKDDSVFEFEVPFVSARPWLSTFGSSGGISLGVLDQLRTTNATTSDISFMVEVAAMPDFEFANYAGPSLLPAAGSTIDIDLVELQSGDIMKASDDKLEEVCHKTIGEKFTSLKEVIMVPVYTAATVTPGDTDTFPLPRWAYVPRATYSVPFAPTGPARFANNPGGFVASMYAFCSGGTTYHAFTNANIQYFTIRPFPCDGNSFLSTTSDTRYRGNGPVPRYYTSGASANAIHAKCPSYQKTPIVPTTVFSNFDPVFTFTRGRTQTQNTRFTSSFYALMLAAGATGVQTLINLGISASDDARCHHFIGPPPVILASSTGTGRLFEDVVRL